VLGGRTGNKIPQYVCLDCRSFSNLSGYREDEVQLRDDAAYVVSKRDHIHRLQSQLFVEIIHRLPHAMSVCEVGCGAGLFLEAVRNLGRQGRGYEINPFAVDYARNEVGVEVHREMFTADHPHRYDLIAAIGVFEHLERPRDLFEVMVSKLNRDGALYLSVPFVNREHWPFLWKADELVPPWPDPFYDNDVHIIHFSHEGIVRMGQQFGARSWEIWESKDTVHHSAGAYPGILFRF
jgi:SAM-dependent methyltransferase